MAYARKWFVSIFFGILSLAAFAGAGGTNRDGAKQDVAAQQNATSAVTTQTDVLTVAKLVLEDSKNHVEEMRETYDTRLWIVTVIVTVSGTLLAFFGRSELKSWIKPYKDDLEKLKTKHADDIQHHLDETTTLNHNNAKGLVAAPMIWGYIDLAENPTTSVTMRQDLWKSIIEQVDRVLPAGDPKSLDSYLAGILLLRKAYALKRLNKYQEAFQCTKQAVDLRRDSPSDEWLYNAACYAALAGNLDDCFELLAQAIKLNPQIGSDAKNDSDFAAVKQDARFLSVLAKQ